MAFSLQSLMITVLVAATFAVACGAGLSRAVWLFCVLAFIPYRGFVSFSGNQVAQSLLPVEVLATILIAVWWIRRRGRPHDPLLRTSFDWPLLLLLPVSCASLLAGVLWVDPLVPLDNVRLDVSIGQVLLLAWPIGIYFVVADTIRDERWMRRIQLAMIVLAVPGFVWVLSPNRPAWSVSFALAAAPWCFAQLLEGPRTWRVLPLAAVAVSPIVAGVVAGKAYWYIAGATGLLTVAFLRARALSLVLVPVLAGLCLLLSYVMTGDPLPPPMRALVAVELAEQSIGGTGGRERLAADAIGIWSRYPVLGVGPGNMWPYMHTYSTLDTAHNQYVNILLELGLAGLICVVIFVVAALKTGLALLQQVRSPFRQHFVTGWIGMFAGVVVGGMTGDVLLPSIRNAGLDNLALAYPQWVALGLMSSLAHIERRERIAGMREKPSVH